MRKRKRNVGSGFVSTEKYKGGELIEEEREEKILEKNIEGEEKFSEVNYRLGLSFPGSAKYTNWRLDVGVTLHCKDEEEGFRKAEKLVEKWFREKKEELDNEEI